MSTKNVFINTALVGYQMNENDADYFLGLNALANLQTALFFGEIQLYRAEGDNANVLSSFYRRNREIIIDTDGYPDEYIRNRRSTAMHKFARFITELNSHYRKQNGDVFMSKLSKNEDGTFSRYDTEALAEAFVEDFLKQTGYEFMSRRVFFPKRAKR